MKDAGWRITQLTTGTAVGRCHSHSYYDIPVLDAGEQNVIGYQTTFEGRQPEPDDSVEVGIIGLTGSLEWTPVGRSTAWSWQQGPMAQWVPGTRRCVWNDRDTDGRFISRLFDVRTGDTRTLPLPVYALDPAGRFSLSLSFRRLDRLRPGYGYAAPESTLNGAAPGSDGIWRMDLQTGEHSLILSLRSAVEFLRSRLSALQRITHRLRRYHYWFNHVKISPDGRRFTVKLRYRGIGARSRWSDAQGVSLTCGVGGSDLRLLASATSHVMWLDDGRLYLWQRDGVYLYRDNPDGGARIGPLAPRFIEANAHVRHLPGDPGRYIFDTPYRQEIDLLIYDARTESAERLARFRNHHPERGPFRCDLHPVPGQGGDRVIVTSLQDGGRQIYLVERA